MRVMQLSPNFTLAELTHTETGLPNNPNPHQVSLLTVLAEFLEKVRARALNDTPITVDDAFRSPEVNARVGGVATSAHPQCYAADIVDETFGPALKVAQAIAAAGARGELVYDQLIYEQHEDGVQSDWVHISRDPRARMQQLTRLPDNSYLDGLHGRAK